MPSIYFCLRKLIVILCWGLSFAQLSLGQFGDKNSLGSVDLDIKPPDVIIWRGASSELQPDGSVEVGLRLETKRKFTIYADKLKVKGPPGTSITRKTLPPTISQIDPVKQAPTQVFNGGDFLFTFSSLEPYKKESFTVEITYLGCTEVICLFPYTETITLPLYQNNVTEIGQTSTPANAGSGPEKQTEGDTADEEVSFAERLEKGELPMWLLLIVIFLGGLATNLTPCVFPMIPITIRILGHQGKSSFQESFIYASGIVVTYTGIGTIVAASGGLFGALLANPIFNAAFGVLFIALGLSMLGFVNFTKLQTVGSKLGQGQQSKLNTFFMGVGAGLVAAPCTGPILAALLLYTAKLNAPALSISLFGLYSVGFAIPYLFLGIAASKISSIKAPAQVQVMTKITFAAVMFALALYYLKTPAYQLLKPIQGSWLLIGTISSTLAVICAFFVLGVLKRLNQKRMIIGPTVLLGVGLFGLFQSFTGADVKSQIKWHKIEDTAYEEASQTGRPILVDGWADWCVACREMDATVFQDSEVVEELSNHWVSLKLDLTELNDETEALAEKYQMPGLPTLVLVPSNGDLSKARRLAGSVDKKRLLNELRRFPKE